MKREDFERLKEEEKKHLREIRTLKQRLKEAQRMQRIGKAVNDIQSSSDLDDLDSSLEEVQRRAAEQEARLDIVIEGAQSADPLDVGEIDEDALKAARAADFIRKMKMSMSEGGDPVEERQVAESKEPEAPEEKDEKSSDFEKTIGRMTPRSPSSR